MTWAMSSWSETSAGGGRWCVAPGLRDVLLGPDGLRLKEWLQAAQAQLVKQGPHRSVYHVRLPHLSFYVKHNRIPDVKTWLRQLVRPSKARIELSRIRALSARGVATVEPLAVGEQYALFGVGESFLITRSLDDTQQLNAFLAVTLPQMEPARRGVIRKYMAKALGRLMARLHDAGIRHDDLHPANILLRLQDDDVPVFYLIDLNAAKVDHPLDWGSSRDNLMLLNRWFVPRASRTDRLRFFRAYCAVRDAQVWGDDAVGPRAYLARARELEERTWSASRRFWDSRDRRCWRNNRYYRQVRAAGVVGHAAAGLDAASLARLLANPDEPFYGAGVRRIKDSPSSTVIELEMAVDGVCRRMIYKRFRPTLWTDPWASLVRRSPALRSWFFGQAFRQRCLPTARPLLVLHRRRHGLFHEGYLLTEKIEHAQDLHQFVVELAELPSAARRSILRQRLEDVARVIRELHRWGYSNRDLKAANILVARAGVAADGEVPVDACQTAAVPNFLPWPAFSAWLIDLVGVQRFRRLPTGRRVQNLARLNASFAHDPTLTRSDRLRFLRVYLQWGLSGRAGWKTWWRAVATATQAKVRRNLRCGRPLG